MGEKTLVIATTNPGKKVEIEALLEPLGIHILSLEDFEQIPPVEEDQLTLIGNAEKKAVTISKIVELPVLADDTGLEVYTLGGSPGVRSARYAGEPANAAANRERLLNELNGKSDRKARFRTVLAYVDGQQVHHFEGVCEGSIIEVERGEGGFGYDSIFVPEGCDVTFAEMPREAKNEISHRGKALRRFVDFLHQWNKQ